MPEITTDQIRDISVHTVEQFLNNKVPLSVGLAKKASLMELNSEQIQRAVEATNSIAHLKIMQHTEDRTIEFPLCKYAQVMSYITLPEGNIIKSASIEEMTPTKKSVDSLEDTISLSTKEQQIHFIKMASINEVELEQLQNRSTTIVPELIKVALSIKEDTYGLQKLASVTEGYEFDILSTIVYGGKQKHENIGIFKAAELNKVESLKNLYKEAQQLRQDIKSKTELSNRSVMVKQALLGAIGKGIGRAVSGIAKVPLKLIGKGVANVAFNTGAAVKEGIGNVANKAKSSLGGKPIPVPKITRKLTGLGVAASAATGAAMYAPGHDSTTGQSRDAWTALQRQ